MLDGIFESLVEGTITNDSYYITEAEVMEEMEKLDRVESSVNLPEDPYDACYESMLINQQNYHNIISSVAVMEMQHLKNNNQIIYEGMISNIFDKIRDFLSAAWEKLKNIYENVLDLFRQKNNKVSSKTLSDFKEKIDDSSSKTKEEIEDIFTLNDAYNINHKELSNTNIYKSLTEGFKDIVKNVYDYGRKGGIAVDNRVAARFKNIKNPSEKIDEVVETKILNKIGYKHMTIDEFTKEIQLLYGISKKVSSIKFTYTELCDCFTTTSKNINSIKTVFNQCKQTIASIKLLIEKAEKQYKQTQHKQDNSSFSSLFKGCNFSISILTIMQREQIKACNTYWNNCYKIFLKLN